MELWCKNNTWIHTILFFFLTSAVERAANTLSTQMEGPRPAFRQTRHTVLCNGLHILPFLLD